MEERADMNKVQQKKWISVLEMGVFILTMLSICILYSDEDKRNVSKNAATTDKMQQNTDNDLPAKLLSLVHLYNEL